MGRGTNHGYALVQYLTYTYLSSWLLQLDGGEKEKTQCQKISLSEVSPGQHGDDPSSRSFLRSVMIPEFMSPS